METNDSDLRCPYDQCGKCLYVGEEFRTREECAVCGEGYPDKRGVYWPQAQWVHATDDIVFLCDNRKLELLTITVAAYFEAMLYIFIKGGMWAVYEPTRIAGTDLDMFDPEKKAEYERRVLEQDELFGKYRSVWKRRKKLCEIVFGGTLDDLLAHHAGDAQGDYRGPEWFMTNLTNIQHWRNEIVHKGASLKHIWPDELKRAIPGIAQEFVRQCWHVFRVLYNEQIHKPWWEEHKPGQSPEGVAGEEEPTC